MNNFERSRNSDEQKEVQQKARFTVVEYALLAVSLGMLAVASAPYIKDKIRSTMHYNMLKRCEADPRTAQIRSAIRRESIELERRLRANLPKDTHTLVAVSARPVFYVDDTEKGKLLCKIDIPTRRIPINK